MSIMVSATPRTGGKTLVANLASRTRTPAAKRADLLASLQAQATKTQVAWCVTFNNTDTGEVETVQINP